MQRAKGTKDVYGKESKNRLWIQQMLTQFSNISNFKLVETPIFENKEVFIKSVGQTSDIVTKEMYDFKDKKGRELALRPEGTAPLMRAIVENKLYVETLPLKLYYQGPMFRYEKPQKGRQRQFETYGVEVLSKEPSPYLDAEVIMFAKNILDFFKIEYKIVLNSLGSKETRDKYSNALKKYLQKYKDQLESISIERLSKNPLRILDDKIESKKDFIINAPKIEKYYSKDDKEYFAKVSNYLEAMGIKVVVDHSLVRGLDYYSDVTFEFISLSQKAGSQSTIIGGGRYNSLLKSFGGPDLSGIGFGIGIERLENEISEELFESMTSSAIDVYVANIAPEKSGICLGILYSLRRAGIASEWNYRPTKLIKSFAKAEKLGAKIVIICGPKELEKGQVIIKRAKKQVNVKIDNILEVVENMLGESHE